MSAEQATVYEPGHVVAGKYELEGLLGQGGMGAVWRARNIALDSPVAIKVVHASGDQALLRGRLMQEARAAAKLTHPAIVQVFDVGQTKTGDPFIVMELLRGDSLGQLLKLEGRLPAVQAVRTLLPIADALWLAHSKGIVHRDLKPDNVFIVQHDDAIQPKLVDFGIVKQQGADVESQLTNPGDVLGSPDYMSPEQARGQDDVNLLTDVWSFCVVLYEAVAGRTPFIGANYNALLRKIVEETPPTLRELAAGDDELSQIVARGLSKQADQRFTSMGELGRALAQWLVRQGATEDICGSTLEAKWLRGTNPHGRPVRSTLTSLSDAWPAEQGSGVRRNELQGSNTLPAPAASAPPAPGPVAGSLPPSQSTLAPPDARPKWQLMAGLIALLALVGTGFALATSLLGQAASTPGLQRQVSPNEAAASSPTPPAATLTSAAAPPNSAAAISAEADEKPALLVPEKVSSPTGRASGTVRVAKPPSASPKASGAGPGKAKAKAANGDLISPY
ncbi:MAG TPA: serine/threonine-protein kinase [Polyangiaceae bacterium]|nr:serine/threonine-protein kinase [Polyangiaceae bacterium]